MIIGEFRIGEDIAVALDAVEGDASVIVVASARMRRSATSSRFVADTSDQPVTMTVAARAASDSIPAGWNITLPAAQSALLHPGTFGIDAELRDANGGVAKTATTGLIRLTGAAI